MLWPLSWFPLLLWRWLGAWIAVQISVSVRWSLGCLTKPTSFSTHRFFLNAPKQTYIESGFPQTSWGTLVSVASGWLFWEIAGQGLPPMSGDWLITYWGWECVSHVSLILQVCTCSWGNCERHSGSHSLLDSGENWHSASSTSYNGNLKPRDGNISSSSKWQKLQSHIT